MAALGDTHTYIDRDTGNTYEFTCINKDPEYWICPTPFYDDWLVKNYGEVDDDGNAYYTINDYNACVQIEDVINHIDQSFHSTAFFTTSDKSKYLPSEILNTSLLYILYTRFSISKILLNNKIYLKATIYNTGKKSIIFPTLGYRRNHINYGFNQTCVFTIGDISTKERAYILPNASNYYKVNTNKKKYQFKSVRLVCFHTTLKTCIHPYDTDEPSPYYTFCSTLDLSLAGSNKVIIRTPVFIYAESPSWSR